MAEFRSSKPIENLNILASPRTAPRTAPRTGLGKIAGNRRIEGKGMPPNQLSTASRAPKLRESCSACAAGKVRCTKERPTCTRCDKRSLSCEYIATKRRGRPSHVRTHSADKVRNDSLQNNASKNVNIPSPLLPCKITPLEMTFPAPSALVVSLPTPHDMNTTIDALPNPLMSTEPTVALSSATAFGAEFDDYFSSLGSFPWLETPTHNISPTSSCVDLSSNTRDSSSGAAFTPEIVFPITENTYSNMQVQSNSDSRPDSRSSDGIESGSTLCSDSRCCCLETALGFLKDLSTNFSQAYTSQGDAGLLFPSVQSVIAKNRRTVEAIDSILQCFCSQDGYLLTILSLIAFRVLDWYAVAASAAPRGTRTADSYKYRIHKPSNVLEWPSSSVSHSSGSLDIDNEGPGRVAAQTVFDELYRAQRLVNKLSARVKEMETSGAIRPSDPIETFLDDEAAWPLLFAILDQLQKDLRKHLRTVSLKIVSMT